MMVVSHNNKCFGGSNPEHAEYGLHAWAVSLEMDHHLYASLQMDEAAPQLPHMHAYIQIFHHALQLLRFSA